MATTVRKSQGKWLLLFALTICSLVFTGCESGEQGFKTSVIQGYVLDTAKNTPIPDALVRAVAGNGQRYEAVTGGNGGYTLSGLGNHTNDLETFTITAEKFGYLPVYPGSQNPNHEVRVGFGDTVTAPVIQMTKTLQLVRGTLRGYPVDAITGAPLNKFTVSIKSPARYKVFESADDFRTNGWTGLEGGSQTVTLQAENYTDWVSAAAGADGAAPAPAAGGAALPFAVISQVPFDLGVVKMNPETVSIHGTLRNLPGYVLGVAAGGSGGGGGTSTFAQDTRIWAEAAGKVVASGSAQAIEGNAIYTIGGVPVTAGAISVKCKIRGYDVVTINPSVNIPRQRPAGVIAGIDANFANIEPIKRDVRVVVTSFQPTTEERNGSFGPGERARVYIREGGRDMVPYVDVTSVNFRAEAYFTGVITGYPLNILVNNLNRGWLSGNQQGVQIPEDGGTVFTVAVPITGGN